MLNTKKLIKFIFVLSLILNLVGGIWFTSKPNLENIIPFTSQVEAVSAEDIYPIFECPCCSDSIDECTCPMTKERRNYVDALIEIGKQKGEEGIVLAYVKKYGLDSFMDESKQQKYREILVKQAPDNRPIISLKPDNYDLGDVSVKLGEVSRFFTLKNEGEENLIINKIETSCGCTFASIIYQGQESPKFNMPGHEINEQYEDWQLTIPPQQEAKLKVYYDPSVHADFRGTAIRSVSVFTNDPVDFEKEVKIELNQVN